MFTTAVDLHVNGETYRIDVEPRTLLSDALRDELGLTGTHVGCEQGSCGACTVLIDGAARRSCLIFAVQASGWEIGTVEGLAAADEDLSALQQAFMDEHGLQCGFCTPGILMSLTEYLHDHIAVSEDEIRQELGGHICRCTGYVNIVRAAMKAASGDLDSRNSIDGER